MIIQTPRITQTSLFYSAIKMPFRFNRKDIDEVMGVPDLAGIMRFIRTLFGWVLGGAFAWVHLRHFPLISVMSNIDPIAISRFLLVILYFSWMAGMNVDLTMQERIYLSDPEEGRVSWWTYISLAALLIAAFALLYGASNEKWLLGALTFFSIVSTILLGKVIERTSSMIAVSRKAYTDAEDYARLEQLGLLEHYLAGKWVWIRAIGLLVLIALIDIVGFSLTVRDWIVTRVGEVAGADFSRALSPILPVLLIATFLLLAEGSQWLMRLRTRISIFLLGSLGRRYHFQKLDRSNPPREPT